REFRVDSEMKVRPLEELLESRDFSLYVAQANLNIEEDESVLLRGPRADFFDECVGHAKAIHAVASRRALRDDDDEMQRWLNRCRRIGLVPCGDFLVELGEHLIGRKLTENTHFLRERIAVECDDSLRRQYGAGKGRSGFHRPVRVVYSRANSGDEGETVARVAPENGRN